MFTRKDIDFIYQFIKDSLNSYHAKSIKAWERDDLRQDIMMKIIRSSHLFKPEKGSLKNWVSRIITNYICDVKRKKTLIHYREDMSIYSIFSEDQKVRDEDELFNERLTHMDNILSAETELDRTMFTEFYLDKFSNREISERHGIPEKKLAMRRRRLKTKIKIGYRNRTDE